jgi:hypothetical protein
VFTDSENLLALAFSHFLSSYLWGNVRPNFPLKTFLDSLHPVASTGAHREASLPIDKRLPNCFRLGFMRHVRDLRSKTFDLGILDVECHIHLYTKIIPLHHSYSY